jgi:hypothetical protein
MWDNANAWERPRIERAVDGARLSYIKQARVRPAASRRCSCASRPSHMRPLAPVLLRGAGGERARALRDAAQTHGEARAMREALNAYLASNSTDVPAEEVG